MKLDAAGAARGIADKIAAPLRLDTVAAAQAIVEIAIAKMSLAVREVSVAKGYDPRDFALVASGGAGPLHVMRDRARAVHPDRDRAAVPLAFLRARHAARRRAPRFHPHVLFRSRQRRFRRAASRSTTRWWPRPRRACATRSDATLPDPSRPALCRPGVHAVGAGRRSRQLKARRPPGDPHRVRRALRASLRAPFAGGAGGDGQHPARRDRQARRSSRFPAVAPARCRDAGAASARPISPAPSKPVAATVYRREALGAGAEIAGPALIQEHGTTTVLFAGDRCRVAPSGELIITGRRRAMTTALDPVTLEVIRNALPAVANEMAADLQRTSYNMMIYEVRDYLHRAARPEGRADLAERRRRVAFRRRSRRHHRRRHEALRPRRLQAGRRDHHQPPGGGRPAPQQRRHLHALFLSRASS